MPNTYENQKSICIHKPKLTGNFLQVANSDWMQANKKLTPFGLQLYLYLASNSDQYTFALSPAAAEEYAGIKPTTFRKYLKLLEIEGYLIWRHGNTYDFYTSPRDPDKRTDPDSHCESIFFEEESQDDADPSPRDIHENASRNLSTSDEHGTSSHDQNCSPSDIEIDNIQIYKDTQKETDNIYAGEPRTPAAPDADASVLPPREEIIVYVPAKPKQKPRPTCWDTDENGDFKF